MILEPLVERSHEAIRQRVQRLAPVCDRFDVDRMGRPSDLRGRDDDTHQGEPGVDMGRLRACPEGVPPLPSLVQSERSRRLPLPEGGQEQVREEDRLDGRRGLAP